MRGADRGWRQPVAVHRCLSDVIEAAGLGHGLGANGTAIEGPWDEVMACVKACHDELHRLGVPRVYTTLK